MTFNDIFLDNFIPRITSFPDNKRKKKGSGAKVDTNKKVVEERN